MWNFASCILHTICCAAGGRRSPLHSLIITPRTGGCSNARVAPILISKVWLYGMVRYHTIRYDTIPYLHHIIYHTYLWYDTLRMFCCVVCNLVFVIIQKTTRILHTKDNPDITYKRQPGYPLCFPPSAGIRTINDTIPIANGKRRPTTHTAKNFK